MKARDLDTADSPLNAEHRAFGLPPLEREVTHARSHPVLRAAMWTVMFGLLAGVTWLSLRLFHRHDGLVGMDLVRQALSSQAFWEAVAVGLVAQAVDGALGMAYGITSTSFLLATGASPAVASAAVHIAEVFTTGVSGVSHLRLGNVDRRLFVRLLVPGIAGAVAGAWLVTRIDGAALKPWIAAYLLGMGLYILTKAARRVRASGRPPRHVAPLALTGGFVDAVGGGGWGPVVTTTLVGTGHDPRTTIGSVNLAEFFLTFASAGVFALLIDEAPWATVAGLVVGGLFAAPLAAMVTRHLHARVLLLAVGLTITGISTWNLWRALA